MKKTTKKTKQEPQWVEAYRDSVAGFKYYDGQKAELAAGDTLKLVREPNNPRDPRAIAVYKGEFQIGHIKAPHCNKLLDLKRDGAQFRTRVVSYHPTNPSWDMCFILVEVAAPEPAADNDLAL